MCFCMCARACVSCVIGGWGWVHERRRCRSTGGAKEAGVAHFLSAVPGAHAQYCSPFLKKTMHSLLQTKKLVSLIFDQPFLEPYAEKLAPVRAAVEANPLLLASPLLLLLPLVLSLRGKKKVRGLQAGAAGGGWRGFGRGWVCVCMPAPGLLRCSVRPCRLQYQAQHKQPVKLGATKRVGITYFPRHPTPPPATALYNLLPHLCSD